MAPESHHVTQAENSRPPTPVFARMPLPGSPTSPWGNFRDHVGNAVLSREFRTAIAFFIFGLTNNILYVIVLSVFPVFLAEINR